MIYTYKIVLGYSYFYVCESVPAVIEMVKDAGLGWEIGSMEGGSHDRKARNRRRHYADRELSDAHTNQIIKVFSDAGFDLRSDDLDRCGMNYADIFKCDPDFFSK